MVLLNFVRVLIAIATLLLVETFRRAWQMEGFALIIFLGFAFFLAFCVSDFAEAWLIDRFNQEGDDADPAARS